MTGSSHRSWSIADSMELYRVQRWGCGFFSIDENGFLMAQSSDHARTRIMDVVDHFTDSGVSPPLIVRFPEIIRKRTEQINHAFRNSIQSYGFQGKYRLFYPVKVNQHQEVVASALAAATEYGGGLEAGSKAELLAMIAMAHPTTPLLCNGFKDATLVDMALRAIQMGRDLTIVIEKPNEAELILKQARQKGLRPPLGVRVKLSSKGRGHWSDSGGSRSKFGLSIPELTDLIDCLAAEGFQDCLTLLHFHPGSQVSEVRTIKSALIEVARVYVNLVQCGVPIRTIDVGGGLAIDYTGNRNSDLSSMNYTLREYANDVVYQIQMVCDDAGVRHPDLCSESGRALTAHHSLLVVPIIGSAHANSARLSKGTDGTCLPHGDHRVTPHQFQPLQELQEVYQELSRDNVLESFHDVQTLTQTMLQMFSNGMLDIWHRAYAEQLGWAICTKINSLLGELEFVPRELEQLCDRLADTYFGNFSVFQAVPDSWALGQRFPVMPIHRLDERPDCYGTLGDITCDSDGKMDAFVCESIDRKSLPLHPLDDRPYYLAILLLGAYQEAISDDHNLMGKFHIATIHDPDDRSTWELVRGSSLRDVLEHVHYDKTTLEKKLDQWIETACASGHIGEKERGENREFFRAMFDQYSYLSGDR